MSVRQLAQNRAWLTTALTVSTVLSCRTWIKIRPEGTPAPASVHRECWRVSINS
jgi:hypothetical protein